MGFLSGKQQMGLAAIILAASAFISRLMGLARDKIISWQFGATHEADMYFAAFITPDIINYLLAGGFMSITIIPILGRLFKNDEKEAWKFFSCVVCWMTLGAAFFTFMCEIWTEQISRLIAPGFSEPQIKRLAFFTRIILPGQIFFLCGASFTALLFLRRQFSVPALSPLIYNGCIIAFGVLLPYIPWADPNFGMTGYCIGVVFGAFIGAFLLPVYIAVKGGLKFQFCWKHPALKKFFMIALPLMLGQTVVMLDEQFLRVFGSMAGEGIISILNYSRRIAQVPVSLVGQAAAVASYPFLVKLLADNENEKFQHTLNSALSASLSLIIPLAAWMIACAYPILGAIFEGGQFGPEQTIACEMPTIIMLCATPAWIWYMVLVRAFYAHENTLTPAITGTLVTIFCIPIFYIAAKYFGDWAIAIVSGTGISIYLAWLVFIWGRKQGMAAFGKIPNLICKSLACSIPAAIVCKLSLKTISFNSFIHILFIRYCFEIIIGGAIFAIIFLPLCSYFQPELIDKIRNLLRRFYKLPHKIHK